MHDALLRRGLKIGHLRILAALAETGRIGAAAEAVGVTQPAASRLLAEVERIAGAPVHIRAGRGVRLTPTGAALARRAAMVLQTLGDAGREIAEIAAGGSGHVRIGSVTGPALDRVLPALRLLRFAAPGITVQVEVGPSDQLGEMLLSGRIDMALARLPKGREAAEFDLTPIGEEAVCLVVRAGHGLLRHPDPDPTDLLAHDWILPGPGAILRDAVLDRLAAAGLPPPRGTLATSSFLLTLAMLRDSNAIAPLARPVAQRFAGPGGCATLLVDLGITLAPYSLITRAGATLPPAAERLRGLLIAG